MKTRVCLKCFENDCSFKLGEQSAKNKIIKDSEKVTKIIKQLCV